MRSKHSTTPNNLGVNLNPVTQGEAKVIALFSKNGRAKEARESRRNMAQLETSEKRLFEGQVELLRQIEAFVVPLDDIDSDKFVSDLRALRKKIESQRYNLKSDLVSDSAFIREFARQQSGYLKNLEDELRGIVEMLVSGLKTVDSDATKFHRNIAQHLESLGSICQVSDLRQLRGALQNEISSLQATLKASEQKQERSMEALASQVTVLRDKLEVAEGEARQDALTGVLNRRALDEMLNAWLEKFNAGGEKFSVILMDLDNFKQINDSFGHAVGDRALLAVVGCCRSRIRQGDVLARYGGDEFVYLLPGSSARNATKVAKKICEELTNTGFELEDDNAGCHQLQLAASFGVTECRKKDSLESIMQRADAALYQAKNRGRGRVSQG